MKFYSQIIGGRDYSLLETVHFGIRLPGTLSSFGDVEPCSLSSYARVKPRSVLKTLDDAEKATTDNKLQCFNKRFSYRRPKSTADHLLENLSFYTFWRMFHINGTMLSQHKQEKFVAITSTGWPQEAA